MQALHSIDEISTKMEHASRRYPDGTSVEWVSYDLEAATNQGGKCKNFLFWDCR
jgi:hypothetical protein